MSEMLFEFPTELSLIQAVFGIQNTWTGGMWTNIFLAGVFSIIFIGYLNYQKTPLQAFIGASSTLFGATMLLLGLNVAGETQVIYSTVTFAIAIVAYYMSTGGDVL